MFLLFNPSYSWKLQLTFGSTWRNVSLKVTWFVFLNFDMKFMQSSRILEHWLNSSLNSTFYGKNSRFICMFLPVCLISNTRVRLCVLPAETINYYISCIFSLVLMTILGLWNPRLFSLIHYHQLTRYSPWFFNMSANLSILWRRCSSFILV